MDGNAISMTFAMASPAAENGDPEELDTAVDMTKLLVPIPEEVMTVIEEVLRPLAQSCLQPILADSQALEQDLAALVLQRQQQAKQRGRDADMELNVLGFIKTFRRFRPHPEASILKSSM